MPSSTIDASSDLFASASSRVGSSSLRPLIMIRSAVLRSSATRGSGSKVWLFVPSGTIPSICTLSPPMLAAIDVIGETVVATSGRSSAASPVADDEPDEQAVRASSAAAAVPAIMRRIVETLSSSPPFCKLFAIAYVLRLGVCWLPSPP